MYIKQSKKIFLISAIFLFLPTVNLLFNPHCNFYNDYLFCYNNPSSIYKVINATYLILVFIGLSFGYLGILKSKTLPNFKYILVVLALFFATTSFTTTDIFYYVGVAKGEVEKSINPYKGGFEKDIDFIKIDGSPMDKPVMYPPEFLQLNKIIYTISPKNDFAYIYTYKLFALVFFVITYILIKKYKSKALASVFLLNPMFLFEFVTNGHLDVYFIFFIVVSILLLLKNKAYLSIYSLFLASLIKFNALLIIPIYVTYKILKSKNFIQYCYSTGAVLLTLLAGVTTVVLFYKPYWFGKDTLLGISLQADWPYNSIFERIVFTKLNPYLYLFNGKYNAQSFIDFWLFMVTLGGIIIGTHLLKNIQLKQNFKKIIKFDFSITKNAVLFYSGFLMFIFPIFGLRYFLPWYLTWSAIYFIFAKFKNREKVLFLQTLMMATYYPAIYLIGHFNLAITGNRFYNYLVISEILLFTLILYSLVVSKIKVYEK